MTPPKEPPLSDDELRRIRLSQKREDSYTLVGKILWRFTIVVGGFLVGAATFAAAVQSVLSNLKSAHQ